MTEYLDRAIEYLGIDKGDVIKHRIQGDDFIVIADLGIKGCPKYYIPLSELAEPEPVVLEEPEILDEIEESPPVNADPELESLTYRALQTMAKDYGISANQGRAALEDALYDALDGE